MSRIVQLFLMLIASISASAQITFQKTYGDSTVNDIGQSILQTGDGGYLIAATRYTTGNQIESLFLIRTDGIGDTLWTTNVNESTVNYSGAQVIQTYDGGFAITGIKGSTNTLVPYLLKIDAAGNMLWNKTYLWFAQERINSIVQTPDSGFLLAGYLYNGNDLVYFIRTNSAGDTLWTKSYKENLFNATIYSVRMTPDGGFVAAGFIQNTGTQDVDAFLFKTDAAGNFLWAKGYGGTGYDYAQQVEVMPDSGFAIAAVTYSFGAGLADFYLIRTDSAGNPLWSKTYGGASDDRSESIRSTPDGGLLFTGEAASFSFGNFDVYMIMTDANGDTIWTKTVNGLENNEGYSLDMTDDGGFAITGTYFNQFSNNDVFFLKADASGFMGCSEVSVPTVTTTPSTQVFNHQLNFLPSEPLVNAHALIENKGTRIETLCFSDGIKEESLEDDLVIYPNPSKGKLAVCSMQSAIKSMEIYSIIGKQVLAFRFMQLRQRADFDVSALSSGIYFIKVHTENRCVIRKIVKE